VGAPVRPNMLNMPKSASATDVKRRVGRGRGCDGNSSVLQPVQLLCLVFIDIDSVESGTMNRSEGPRRIRIVSKCVL